MSRWLKALNNVKTWLKALNNAIWLKALNNVKSTYTIILHYIHLRHYVNRYYVYFHIHHIKILYIITNSEAKLLRRRVAAPVPRKRSDPLLGYRQPHHIICYAMPYTPTRKRYHTKNSMLTFLLSLLLFEAETRS